MKFSTVMKSTCALMLTVSCLGVLAGCNGEASKTVAATVNDLTVYEEDVTARINDIRTQYSLNTDDDWGNWLVQYDMTPESLREEIINEFVDEKLVELAAKEQGITVEDSAVDDLVAQMKANYKDDEAWADALKSAGTTEEKYRETLKEQLLQRDLENKVTEGTEISEKDLVKDLNMYSSYLDGMKKSSHILFSLDDESTAKDVLAKLKDGSLKFKDAVAQYSTDTGSAADGGNVGWDRLNSFVTEYTDGLDKLKKGEMSDLVKSEYGYHIILCTDEFKAPKKIKKSSDVPSEIVDFVKEQASSSAKSDAYDKWLEEYKKNVTIDIKEMPADAKYAIDMSGYQKSDDSADAADDEAADDTAAEDAEDGEEAEAADAAADDAADDKAAGESK